MAKPPDFVCIYEPFTRQDAALVHAALSGTGISYQVQNEFLGGTAGLADSKMGLLVERGRAEEALT
jgi:hypothetical protein